LRISTSARDMSYSYKRNTGQMGSPMDQSGRAVPWSVALQMLSADTPLRSAADAMAGRPVLWPHTHPTVSNAPGGYRALHTQPAAI
jgi:hypothetical protein